MYSQDFARLVRPCLALIFVLGGGNACRSKTPATPAVAVWSCEDRGSRPPMGNVSCPVGERFVKGVCAAVRCDATELACCPGMTCDGGGSCNIPPIARIACEDNAACPSGMRCFARDSVSGESKTCGWLPVDTAGGCPEGGQAFNQRCVLGVPCSGGCSAGAICNIDTNRCERAPVVAADADVDNGCGQTCAAAELLVYSDPDAMIFDQCCAVTCACESLPGLAPGNWGRFSDSVVVVDQGQATVWTSAFDSRYGDLVVASLDGVSGNVKSLEYIDGLPVGAPVVADPNGLRGGQVASGPDVGRYTSIARSSAGTLYVAYYDYEHGSLKLAHRAAGVPGWTTSVVDAAAGADPGADPGGGVGDGDVGLFASLVLEEDESGPARLHLSYLAQRALVEVDAASPGRELVTAPVYAQSIVALPTGPDDWRRLVVDPLVSCAGRCDASIGEVCVRVAGSAVCRVADVGADGKPSPACACACDETCVTEGCFETLPEVLAQPCSGFCAAGQHCVADDAAGTSVCLANVADGCGCGADEICVDVGEGEAGCRQSTPYSRLAGRTASAGMFTSLLLQGGVPTVVYYDAARRHLRAAVAGFSAAQEPNSFASFALRCAVDEDIGRHAAAAVHEDGSLAVVFQGRAGTNLWMYRGADLLTGSFELVDGGGRGSRVSVVGAAASVAFSADGTPYVAYSDQTKNDLLISVNHGDGWQRTTLLSAGAYGTAAKLHIVADTAYLTSYLRQSDESGGDLSRLILTTVALDQLP